IGDLLLVSGVQHSAAGGLLQPPDFGLRAFAPFQRLTCAAVRGSVQMLLVFFVKGIVVGIVIAVPVGPVGVMCIRRTVFEGKLAGFVSGLGAATADAVFGIIAGFGLTVVSDWLLGYQQWLRFAGAGLLLAVGGHSLLAKQPSKLGSAPNPESLSWYYASTFALTLTNPITILSFFAFFAPLCF